MIRAIAVAVVVMAATMAGGAAARAVAPVEQAAGGIGGMAWDLVRASNAGNAIVSPVSVWEALAMTHAGARGETAAEIAHVLGMPDDRAAIAAASEALRKLFAEAKGEKITLDVANRIWVQKEKQLEGEFTSLLEDKFGAGAGRDQRLGERPHGKEDRRAPQGRHDHVAHPAHTHECGVYEGAVGHEVR